MSHLSCLIATTQQQLDDAVRVRWSVFGAELSLLASPPAAPREVSCFDTLATTVHFVVYAGLQPVATMRLLLPNAEVARATGRPLGLELEQKLELSALCVPGVAVAETTRCCVLRAWRGSEALVLLNAAMYRESRRRGVTHWVACANMETDSAEDAGWVYQVAARRGLLCERFRVQPRAATPGPAAASAPLYTPEHRALARAGQLDTLRLPPALGLFSRKLAARFPGEPLYDAHFRRYALPLVSALEELPASTLRLFEAAAAPRLAIAA